VEISLPPLRERKEDILLLLDFFMNLYTRKYGKEPIKVQPSLLSALQQYGWPGNIRELRFAVERAVILSDSNQFQDIDLFISRHKPATKPVDEIVTLEEKEKNYILQVLAHYDGNVTQAASALGLTRTAMYRRLNKYDIR
jgi:DNA-binding NtrC family response regulator